MNECVCRCIFWKCNKITLIQCMTIMFTSFARPTLNQVHNHEIISLKVGMVRRTLHGDHSKLCSSSKIVWAHTQNETNLVNSHYNIYQKTKMIQPNFTRKTATKTISIIVWKKLAGWLAGWAGWLINLYRVCHISFAVETAPTFLKIWNNCPNLRKTYSSAEFDGKRILAEFN